MAQGMNFSMEDYKSMRNNGVNYGEKLANQTKAVLDLSNKVDESWKGSKAQACINALNEVHKGFDIATKSVEPFMVYLVQLTNAIKEQHGEV